jgi:predicted phosphodiesterase
MSLQGRFGRAAKAKASREQKEAAERHLAALERELRDAKARASSLAAERVKLLSQLEVVEALDVRSEQVKKRLAWLSPSAPSKGHRATLTLMVSDTHFDEVVDPAEVQDANAYNRAIAEQRLRRTFEGGVRLAKHYLSGVTYDGCVLLLGGDIFSGNIHEELARTNADTIFGSFLYWMDPMLAGIELLVKEFGRAHIVAVVGNHGRMSRKPIAKQRALDNLDYLFYRTLHKLAQRDGRMAERVTWEVPRSPDANFSIYSVKYQLTHGDQFKGGSGISGLMAPLALGQHRKSRRQALIGKPYDYLVHGHWHQQTAWKQIIGSGSLKGYDEFAFVNNWDFEVPQQPLWITTPERGITFSAPVFSMDRKEEGW